MHSTAAVAILAFCGLGAATVLPPPITPIPQSAEIKPPEQAPPPPPSGPPPPDNIPGHLFKDNALQVARDAAPAWHMDQDSCMPTSARRKDESKTPGIHPVTLSEPDLNDGCEAPDMNHDVDADPHPFPTYWVLRHCDGDNTWRIGYDVYFQKDTGHIDDWEYAVVKFTQTDKKKDLWKRAGMWMERDGDRPFTKWGDLKNTFTDNKDIHDRGKQGKPRPLLWFGKWRHPVFDYPCTDCGDDFPFEGSGADYRSSDFVYDARDWLKPGSDIPAKWKWGEHATSFPASFNAGGTNDLCKF